MRSATALSVLAATGIALAMVASGCDTAAIVGKQCNTDADCGEDQSCINGTCQSGSGACTSNDDCQGDLICGVAGLCTEAPPATPCTVTGDCPLEAYCNTGLPDPTCMPLLSGSCREESQCSGGLSCSALPGGVGRCVECLRNSDCASGQCLSDGTCAGGARDAGGSWDGSYSDDPSCGGDGQPCCGASSSQQPDCDNPSLSCLSGFPGAADAYCWRSCRPTPCTTLEGEDGWCHVASNWDGDCQGTMAYTCTIYQGCTSGSCILFDDVSGYCLAMGCDWQGDCGAGYYCSTYDGNLCLDVDLLQ